MDYQRNGTDLMGANQQVLMALGGDPYIANVVALLHMNGSDASTTFTDVKAHTFTASGNAQIDTAQSKFGGASGLFDGTGDYISTPDSGDWSLGSGNFTIECWIRPNATGAQQYICGQSNAAATATTISFVLRQTPGNKVEGFINSGSGSFGSCISAASVSAGNWYHVAYVRNGTAFKIYLDGTGTAGGTTSNSVNDSADIFAIGRLGSINSLYFNGWIDEFRLTKDVARYTSNFTPPTAPFPDS